MRIVIEGKPIPQKRPRFARMKGFVKTYDPQSEEKKTVKTLIKSQVTEKLEGPLKVNCIFYLHIPLSFSKKKKQEAIDGVLKPATKSDIDNYVKFYFDCMNGIAWRDDSQVVELKAEKVYSSRPRTEIEIEEKVGE